MDCWARDCEMNAIAKLCHCKKTKYVVINFFFLNEERRKEGDGLRVRVEGRQGGKHNSAPKSVKNMKFVQ